MLPPIGYQALRKGRVSEAGRLYFVTKKARERVQKEWTAAQKVDGGVLIQPGISDIIMDALDWLQQNNYITLLAYCLMPDHLHLLFQLGEVATLEKVMHRFGSFTGHEIFKQTGQTKIWFDGYHDHALRAEDELENIVNYIEYNPVRAGLVAETQHWPLSSARQAK